MKGIDMSDRDQALSENDQNPEDYQVHRKGWRGRDGQSTQELIIFQINGNRSIYLGIGAYDDDSFGAGEGVEFTSGQAIDEIVEHLQMLRAKIFNVPGDEGVQG